MCILFQSISDQADDAVHLAWLWMELEIIINDLSAAEATGPSSFENIWVG